MEDHTDSISESQVSPKAKCNLKNIFFGLKYIYQKLICIISKVKASGFKSEVKSAAFAAGKSFAICMTIGLTVFHVFYWMGLAKVSLFGGYRGINIDTESLPFFMFGTMFGADQDPRTTSIMGQVFAEGLSLLGLAILAFVVIGLLRAMASGICDLGQKQIQLEESDK